MKTVHLLIPGVLTPSVLALQATTTRYYDGQEGACGCGNGSNFPWQLGISSGVYTAAGSQALFDQGGSSWCGAGCGICYQLTSTGSSPDGAGGASGQSIIVMVTNLCPNNGNQQWCPPVGGTNQYGYQYHFDIMAQGEVFGDNPVVNFQQVACPGAAISDYSQCHCPKGSGGVSGGGGSPAPAPSPSPPPSSGGGSGQAQKWGQCGGIGWTGPTACVSGSSCQYSNPWYSQCL